MAFSDVVNAKKGKTDSKADMPKAKSKGGFKKAVANAKKKCKGKC